MKLKRILFFPRLRWLTGLWLLAGWLASPVARAQVEATPCTAPKIKVGTACGGVVTLALSGGAVSGATYSWNLGNGGTATGFGPINAVYTTAGPFTVTLTVSTPACEAVLVSTARVAPDLGSGCCPVELPTSRLLGGVGVTTTLAGGATYSGTYRVLGDLVLKNGNYVLSSGTTFYVDGKASKLPDFGGGYQRTVTGSSLTLGNGGRLLLDGATITASGSSPACPMWRGIVIDGYLPDNSPPQVVIGNGSVVSHAYCGLEVLSKNVAAEGVPYSLTNSTFANNLTDVLDQGTRKHRFNTGGPAIIQDSFFNSDAAQMHYPYDQTSASDQFITYQALLLLPRDEPSSGVDAVQVLNNQFNHVVYGIINNLPGRGSVRIEGNFMNFVFGTGIWTVNNSVPTSPTGVPTTRYNIIELAGSTPGQTGQFSATSTLYGLVGETSGDRNAFRQNSVLGPANNSLYKPMVGLSVTGSTDVSGHILSFLTQGMATTELTGSTVFDNLFIDCQDGFVVQPSSNGLYQTKRLGCNTFQKNNLPSSYASRGIVVQPNATINDIGSNSSPAANRFDGMDEGIRNDNTASGFTLRYYRMLSSQEMPTLTGLGNTQIIPAANQPNPVDYCTIQGASNSNGVNDVRTASGTDYLAAIMDSVRRQLAPPARCRGYLYEIVTYHRDAQQLAALETWWNTLPALNAPAYRTVGRFLLRAYDQQPATTTDAQRILAGLQPAALLDAELAAQLQLRAVLRHLPQTMPRLAAADSTVLRALAWSGTSTALPAGRWLRYFHPLLPLPGPVITPGLRPASARPLVANGAELGAAYPNPAQTEVRISCKLARAGQAAELRFTNLLTGQLALVVPVEGTGTERSQQVALQSLPAGQYAYQLVVDGQLAAPPQKLVVNP